MIARAKTPLEAAFELCEAARTRDFRIEGITNPAIYEAAWDLFLEDCIPDNIGCIFFKGALVSVGELLELNGVYARLGVVSTRGP